MSRDRAVILAGGDGVRLRSMTRSIAGDERPKQFCALVGPDALLTETRRRTALARPVLTARPDTLAVLPVRGVDWSDLGDPERVLATRRRTQPTPVREPMRQLVTVSISA
jgi:hypothetical protein